jgi:hypothetical protein
MHTSNIGLSPKLHSPAALQLPSLPVSAQLALLSSLRGIRQIENPARRAPPRLGSRNPTKHTCEPLDTEQPKRPFNRAVTNQDGGSSRAALGSMGERKKGISSKRQFRAPGISGIQRLKSAPQCASSKTDSKLCPLGATFHNTRFANGCCSPPSRNGMRSPIEGLPDLMCAGAAKWPCRSQQH